MAGEDLSGKEKWLDTIRCALRACPDTRRRSSFRGSTRNLGLNPSEAPLEEKDNNEATVIDGMPGRRGSLGKLGNSVKNIFSGNKVSVESIGGKHPLLSHNQLRGTRVWRRSSNSVLGMIHVSSVGDYSRDDQSKDDSQMSDDEEEGVHVLNDDMSNLFGPTQRSAKKVRKIGSKSQMEKYSDCDAVKKDVRGRAQSYLFDAESEPNEVASYLVKTGDPLKLTNVESLRSVSSHVDDSGKRDSDNSPVSRTKKTDQGDGRVEEDDDFDVEEASVPLDEKLAMRVARRTLSRANMHRTLSGRVLDPIRKSHSFLQGISASELALLSGPIAVSAPVKKRTSLVEDMVAPNEKLTRHSTGTIRLSRRRSTFGLRHEMHTNSWYEMQLDEHGLLNDAGNIVCPVCQEAYDVGADNFYVLDGCNHGTCKTCLTKTLNEGMKEGSTSSVHCPLNTCRAKFSVQDVWDLLDKDGFDHYLDCRLQELIATNSGKFFSCPKCGITHEYITPDYLDDDDRRANLTKQLGMDGKPLSPEAQEHFLRYRMLCRECTTVFCLSCRIQPYHLGFTCDDYREYMVAPHCRFCDTAIIHKPNQVMENVPFSVCEDPSCIEKMNLCCLQVLHCGHACGGVRGEHLGISPAFFTTVWALDTLRCGNNIAICNEGKTAIHTADRQWNTVLLNKSVTSGVATWKLRIDKTMRRSNLGLGVAREDTNLNKGIGLDRKSWGFIGNSQRALWHDGVKVKSGYGNQFEQGDIITVVLDLDNGGTLCFTRNDQDMGIAFSGLDAEVYPLFPCFVMYDIDERFTLLDFSVEHSLPLNTEESLFRIGRKHRYLALSKKRTGN